MLKLFLRMSMACCVLGAFGTISAPAQTNTPTTKTEKLAEYRSWAAYKLDTGTEQICYITAKPIATLPQGVIRGDIFFSISHRPGEQIRNEVGVRVGYPFSDTSRPYATIGERRFQFFTGASLENGVKEWAWVSDIQQHASLIMAMKRGARLTFRGTSMRGTLTTDTYSLLGFTKAMEHIDAACP